MGRIVCEMLARAHLFPGDPDGRKEYEINNT
jgi:hypothetical protein